MRKTLVFTLILCLSPFIQARAVTYTDTKGQTLSAGGDIRWRYVVTENIFDLKDSSGTSIDAAKYYRNRIRLWTKFGLADNISATLRITAEPWWGSYFKNDNADITKTRWPLEFDNAFLEMKDALINGLSIRLGRQDLVYGDPAFLIIDGTPADGSRTMFHDGVKLSYSFDEGTTVDLFGMTILENDYGLDDDLDMQGVYFISDGVFKALPDHKLELYTLRNHTGADTRSPDNINEKIEGDSEDIVAPGIRLSGAFVDSLVAYSAEANLQIGGSNAVTREGFGYYANLTLSPGAKVEAVRKYAPKLKAGYYVLSGDDPTTAGTNEGFFHFTNQWPTYSELYIYTLLGPNLGEPTWWSNMTLAEGQLSVMPTSKLTLTARVGIFGAEYEYVRADGAQGEGLNRGAMVHLRLDYNFTANVCGQLLGEWFLPGDYYTFGGVEADTASFLRAMTFVKF